MKTIEIKGKRVPVPWRESIHGDVIFESGDVEHIICGAANLDYQPLIIAAPELFVAAKNFLADISAGNLDPESMQVLADLIEELETP